MVERKSIYLHILKFGNNVVVFFPDFVYMQWIAQHRFRIPKLRGDYFHESDRSVNMQILLASGEVHGTYKANQSKEMIAV
jgi:Rad3-related DNA helicase